MESPTRVQFYGEKSEGNAIKPSASPVQNEKLALLHRNVPKRYMGGYKHKETGVYYLHATTQTLTPMEKRAMVMID
jgi:hypothetical protein